MYMCMKRDTEREREKERKRKRERGREGERERERGTEGEREREDSPHAQLGFPQSYLTGSVLKVVLQKSTSHKFVNLSFTVTNIKNTLTNLCGN